MNAVFDTTAFIYITDLREFDRVYTVQEVIDEVRDIISKIKMEAMHIAVEEPRDENVRFVLEKARSTGDLDKLTKTDIKVLALSLEKKLPIVSDDRNIQNVAESLDIVFIPLFSKGIKKLITWKKFCDNCKKLYSIEVKECPICGSALRRIVWRKKRI